VLPVGLSGLVGAACAVCCAIPVLIAAGMLGGAGWAAAGRVMPGVAIGLTAAAVGAWWWATRRRVGHAGGCAGRGSCPCGEQPTEEVQETIPVRSSS
jgi:hypothetical protein